MNKFILTSFFVIVCTGSTLGGRLRVGPKCKTEPITISATVCKLEYDKVCSTESKVVGDRISYEKGDCKEVEICKPPSVFVPRRGGFLKKREASPDYFDVECEKETKEICKRVPVKTPVERNVETCTKTPREVCETKEREAPQITCDEIKLSEDEEQEYEDDFDYLARFG